MSVGIVCESVLLCAGTKMDVVVEDGNGRAGEEEVVMGDPPVVSGGRQVPSSTPFLSDEMEVFYSLNTLP